MAVSYDIIGVPWRRLFPVQAFGRNWLWTRGLNVRKDVILLVARFDGKEVCITFGGSVYIVSLLLNARGQRIATQSSSKLLLSSFKVVTRSSCSRPSSSKHLQVFRRSRNLKWIKLTSHGSGSDLASRTCGACITATVDRSSRSFFPDHLN